MPIKIIKLKHTPDSRSKSRHTAKSLKPDIPIKVNGPQGMHKQGIPREPDYSKDEDRILYEEQQTSRVEALMLKGYRDRLKLSKLLDITPNKCDDYIRRVFARWEIEGGQKHFTTYRGEMVLKLRQIEIEMWEAIEAEKAKVNREGKLIPVSMERLLTAYGQVTAVSLRRAEMLGLTKEMVERMMETETEENLNFKRKSETYDNASRVAARLMDLVDEYSARKARQARLDSKVIEHESSHS